MPMPNCDVCQDPAIGVACSRLGPISFAYCRRCTEECAEPYGLLVGMVAINGGLDNFHSEMHHTVEASLKVAGKTMEEFEEDVAAEAIAMESYAKDLAADKARDEGVQS